MSGLNRLTVSLTKNGFQKIADVIINHPRNEVLANIQGSHPGINLDEAQVLNILSADPETRELPAVWDEIKRFGDNEVRALTFIAILYSHHKLIQAFSDSATGEMRGTLQRSSLGEKAYTNIVFTMQSFGISEYRPGATYSDYSFATIFANMQIGPLAKKIIQNKLERTGWQQPPEGDEFQRTFYEQCIYFKFHKALALSPEQFEEWLEGRSVQVTAPPIMVIPSDECSVNASLVTALATKPFVILCGASGTGKTTSVRHLVSSLAAEDTQHTDNHAFIPVEAGWTDGRHLIGYKNPFGANGEYYVITPVVELLLKANYPQYSDIPFFIILDEMNLSYVEMYFSKFLSIMETARSISPEAVVSRETLQLMLRSGMLTPEQATMADAAISRGGLYLSKNVFIVGTVNIDETTHSFSPKVLDRAFVIEVSCEKPSLQGTDYIVPEIDRLRMPARDIAALLIGEASDLPAIGQNFSLFIDDIFEQLGPFKFGPRVTNEIRRYIAVTKSMEASPGCPSDFASDLEIKDRILMQKILPKLNGNRAQLGNVLAGVLNIPTVSELTRSKRKLKAMVDSLGPLGTSNFFISS